MATENEVLGILSKVDDPEVGISIVDMGLIENVAIKGDSVEVEMVLTTPFCPLANLIVSMAKEALLKKFKKADVKLNLDKPWDTGRLSNEAKKRLNLV